LNHALNDALATARRCMAAPGAMRYIWMQ
jgi:hypothetical protein